MLRREINSQRNHRGFTLIEMITVIVLLGIIAGILTPFIAKAMQAYTHSKARSSLVARGHLALERMAREVRVAVPNSLSVLNAGTGIEFMRTKAGGRYVERFDNFATNFSKINCRFRKNANLFNLYAASTGLSVSAGDVLVIGNTSPTELRTGNTATILSGVNAVAAAGPCNDGVTVNGQVLNFASHPFTVESPGRHFSIADQTIEIGLTGDSLRWFSSQGLGDYNASKDWDGGDPALVDGVSAISFTYAPGNPQSTGVLRVNLQLMDVTTSQTIRLYREIQVRNTP